MTFPPRFHEPAHPQDQDSVILTLSKAKGKDPLFYQNACTPESSAGSASHIPADQRAEGPRYHSLGRNPRYSQR